MTTAAPSFTIADQYQTCFSCMNAIEEGQKVFQRDGASVCESCDPLYDLPRISHAGGITSKRGYVKAGT